jgi:hypothetical protein
MRKGTIPLLRPKTSNRLPYGRDYGPVKPVLSGPADLERALPPRQLQKAPPLVAQEPRQEQVRHPVDVRVDIVGAVFEVFAAVDA